MAGRRVDWPARQPHAAIRASVRRGKWIAVVVNSLPAGSAAPRTEWASVPRAIQPAAVALRVGIGEHHAPAAAQRAREVDGHRALAGAALEVGDRHHDDRPLYHDQPE